MNDNNTTTTVKPTATAPLFSLGTLNHEVNFSAMIGPALILMGAWFGVSVILILIKSAAYK